MSARTSLVRLLDGPDDDIVAHAGGATSTRAELRDLARALAADLRARDLGGRAIGVLMPNTPDTIAAWFGVWDGRSVFVPMNPRVPARELMRSTVSTGVAAVVTTHALAAALEGRKHSIDGTPFEIVCLDPDEERVVTPDQAIVQFTSGTTGTPKAVVLRHDTVSELLDTVIGTLRGARQDRAAMPNLVPMSLALWAGIYQVLFAFKIGAPVVLMKEFDPGEFARLVKEHGIKSSVLPPAALVMLTDDEAVTTLEPLRYVRSVSAPLSPAHARRFHERFGVAILNGYGQTELGGEAIGWSAADWKEFGAQKLGAVGRPHAAFQLRVRGDDGQIADTDGVGELEIRSSAALPPDDAAMEDRVTPDGWLKTGDLARIDADGFVWIEGRVSAMINRGGLKVFPDEVEERIRELDGVTDVAVVGVPDERLGEVPWAFIVGRTDLETVQAWCRRALAPYKAPVGCTLVGALPRNEMGKVLRQDLVPLVVALLTVPRATAHEVRPTKLGRGVHAVGNAGRVRVVERLPMARLDAISTERDAVRGDRAPDSWQDDAACRGSDTSVFFPASEADAGAAQAICATCPVAEACLEYAIATRQPDGVWGGLTPSERHRLLRRRQKAARKARAAASDAAA